MEALIVGLIVVGWVVILMVSMLHYMIDEWRWLGTKFSKVVYIFGGVVLWSLAAFLIGGIAYYIGLAILGGS